MERHGLRDRARRTLARVRRMLRRRVMPGAAEPPMPEDPYAYVGAPKKPRPPLKGTAVAEPLE